MYILAPPHGWMMLHILQTFTVSGSDVKAVIRTNCIHVDFKNADEKFKT